jgi:hypothetical protein
VRLRFDVGVARRYRGVGVTECHLTTLVRVMIAGLASRHPAGRS